jgi:hypothetical protein
MAEKGRSMAISFRCECGKRFRAEEELRGRRGTCPQCKREFVVREKVGREPPAADAIPRRVQPVAPVQIDISAYDEVTSGTHGSHAKRAGIAGWLVAGLLLVALCTLPWILSTKGSQPRSDAQQGQIAALVSARNPRIPVEVTYPVIGEYFSPEHPTPSFPGKRTIEIRLNTKVSESVLREIALELKAKETTQYEYTRIFFYLPGKGPGVGPGNTSPWASADFDSGLQVYIMGLSLDQETEYRTRPLNLPAGSVPFGTWIIENGAGGHPVTIYSRDNRVFYDLQYGGSDGPGWIEMEELPTGSGRAFRTLNNSTDRYIVLPNGDLELYTGEGKLLYHLRPVQPPPPTGSS